MPLIINTNVMSLNAQRHLGINTTNLSKSLEKLASGYRINRAGDDAAGLQLSENLRAQIRGSKKALDNVQDGMNVLNIADGAYQTIQNNLQRIRELVVQAASDTYSEEQRDAMVQEMEQLLQDNNRMAASTQFNGVNLLDGSVTAMNASGVGGFFLQVGPNDDADNDRIDLAPALADLVSGGTATNAYLTNINAMFSTATNTLLTSGAGSGTADGVIDNNEEARDLLGYIDGAMTELNSRRGNIGALYNRLEGTAQNLMISIENLSASESRIRNVDVAAESANMIQHQILQQASNTILMQANQSPSLALSLLQG